MFLHGTVGEYGQVDIILAGIAVSIHNRSPIHLDLIISSIPTI